MPILLVELNPNEISVDETLFPDQQKDEFIYEHLRHYCSKFYPLPTIEVRVYTKSVFVVRGHLYLAIARDFKHQRIRAVIDKNSSNDCVMQFLQNPSVSQLDWQSVIQQEQDNELVSYIWLVFFFSYPLTQETKKKFEAQIVQFFKQIQLPTWAEVPGNRIKDLNYPYSGYCAEFQAYIPVEDERWYASSRAVLVDFHLECVPILSFQGRKFRVE